MCRNIRGAGLFARRVTVMASITAALSCSGDPGTAEPSNALAGYVSRVTSLDGTVTASFHPGALPTASGPIVAASEGDGITVGAPWRVNLDADSPFTRAIVSVQGVDGYYELDGVNAVGESANDGRGGSAVANATHQAALLVTTPDPVPRVPFALSFRGGDANGVGPASIIPIRIRQSDADVNVNLSWSTESNLDLHVVPPNDSLDEIYYGHDSSAVTNGYLNIDSNAGCNIDHVKSESIVWPSQAPPGSYQVRVDMHDACGVTDTTRYVVTLSVDGHATRTYTGFFLPSDQDRGGRGSGRDVATFSFP
jgi:hypothetical protein